MAERLEEWLGPTSSIMGMSQASASGPFVRSTQRSQPILSAASTSPDDRLDERSIVDAVLAGDRDAYRLLVERESASIVRACHRILGNLHDAEDAAQEAFVTAFRSLPSWRGDGPFGAWLTRIAVRIALREAGRRRAVAWLDPSVTSPDVGKDAVAAPSGPSSTGAPPWSDPAVQALRAERATDLRVAVATLPEPYREVVTLRFFGDLSLEEIARVTERPLGTIKTQLRRGLLRMRGTVEPGGEE